MIHPLSHCQDRFSTAIEEEWYGELCIADLPMWVYVGEGESEDFLLGEYCEEHRRGSVCGG